MCVYVSICIRIYAWLCACMQIALCSYMLMRGASVRSSVDPQGRSALHVAMEGKNRTISLEILYKCIEREVPNGATQEEKSTFSGMHLRRIEK